MSIDTDKAYLIGLLIGGGVIANNNFQIILPYKKWGDLKENTARAGGIAQDILAKLNPIWKSSYNLDVSYKIGTDWRIVSNTMSPDLLKDLELYGLPQAGELRNTANLKGLLPLLRSDEHKKRFIVGLVDTIGSLARSHRRFNDAFQIISFEFKGNNFSLVKDVISLLESINIPPDQVLWNHPNQHSGLDRYYSQWKKGFKVRVALTDYMLKGSFVFETKKLSAQDNAKNANLDNSAIDKEYKIKGRVSLHKDQSCDWIPKEIRGYHFIHNLHFNAIYGLSIPDNFSLKPAISACEKYICPFTILTKGPTSEIENIIEEEDYLKRTSYKSEMYRISNFLTYQKQKGNDVWGGKGTNDGFPINHILHAAAYVISAQNGDVSGKRVKGNFMDTLEAASEKSITLKKPNRGTCLIVESNGYSGLIGYINNTFNKKLIEHASDYKVKVREPSFDECVEL